jgi:hypothetical protein
MPLPNQTGTQNLAGTSDTDHNEDQFFTRIDHKITDNDRLFGRYVYSQLIYDQSGLNKAFSTLTRVREQNVALNWTHVFSPTILNEVRLGYQRSIWTDRGPRTDTDFDAGQVLGISGIQTPSGTGVPSNLRGYPTFQVQGFLGLSDGGRGLRDLSETRQFVNNLNVTRSAHNLKMGVDLRLVRDDIPGSNVPRGLFAFTGELSGNAWADLVLGLPRNVNNAEGNPTPELRGERYAAYMQDDWKISRKLTVNLGVRWEYFTVIHDISGISRTLRFDLPGGPQLWPEPGTPANLYDSQPFRFFPRVGIAYRMTDKTVIRSGYGRFQIANAFTFLSPPSRNPPFFGAPLIQNPLPPDAPIVDLSNPFAVPASVPTFPQLQVIDPDFKNGDMQNWSFNVGHQFTQNDVLEIGYVGTKGTHGVRSDYNFNQPRPGPGAVQPRRPIPQFSRIRMFRSDYNSHSSSMHVRFEHRFSRGFSVHSSYAWSHQIDEDFSGQDNVDAVPIGPQDSLDRRSERGHGAFDVRHRFTASYIWEMPFARTSGSRLARILLRDWTVDGILTLQTGFPFTVIQSGDSQGADNGVGPDNSGQARPDILPGARITASDPDPARWFNTDAFSRSTFHFGNAGRNILFGPGTRTFALGIFRAIPLPREGHRLQFRYEVFNLFNTPNFGQPGNTLGTGNFGRITSTIGDSRQMQFALKYMF